MVVVEESDYMKQWKSLPRSKRDRLTKKQIAMIDKPDLMTDAFAIPIVREKKAKGTLVVEEKGAKSNDLLFDTNQQALTKNYKED